MKTILEICNLNYIIDDKVIFNNLNMLIKENSINCILGANNSGKTTLLKFITGFLKCDCKIKYNSELFDKYNKKNKFIGFSFYRDKKIKSKTLNYYLTKKLRNRGIGFFKSKRIIKDYSTLMELNEVIDKDYNKLTQIDKVKFNILYTIISNPKVIVLDDIFEYISFEQYCYISELLKKITNELHITVIYTSKKLEMGYKSDNIFFLNKGHVELNGSFNEISKHDNLLIRNGITISPIIDISLKLQFYNLIDKVKTNVNDMVNELWKQI